MSNLEKTGHVLIIDRYETTKTILRMSIEYICPRCRITTACHSRDALDTLQNDDVRLVLADFDTPGLGGLELIKTIHKAWPDVRLIAMGELDDLGRTSPVFSDLKIDGFLARPVGLNSLEKLLMTTL